MSQKPMLSTATGLRGLSYYRKITFHQESCVTSGEISEWVVTGWTVLLLKNKNKVNELSNYLFTYMELITIVVTAEIQSCCRNSICVRDQLLVYKAVIRNCKEKKVRLRIF